MPFGGEFSEKLTHLLGATALCCFVGTLPPGIIEHATVEAMLGAAGLGVFLARTRTSKAGALLRRCVEEVEPGIDALLAREYRDDPDPEARRGDALAAVYAVLPSIEPQPGEFVTARLGRDGVVAFYLARAAGKQPARFGNSAEDTLPRRLLEAVIGNAWRRILEQPEFRDDVLRDTLRELLSGLDELREGQQAIRDDVSTLPDAIVDRIIAELDARGLTRKAEEAGLERQVMIRLARRLRPDEILDFDQAVAEVEHAVGIALDVIARGERGGNLDAFVKTVLRHLAETTRAGEFDRGSLAVDDALRALERREAEQRDAMRRSRTALLEAGIEQDTLRRDAAAVARRIEALVTTEQPGERPAWTPAFRQRQDALYEEGRSKGINFSLEVAEALAQCMLDAARDRGERGSAGNLLGIASQQLGTRESGTTRLERAVAVYHAVLLESTRERGPQNWAITQNNLGNALLRLGERESSTARLEQAAEAYRAALVERTRERAPTAWAMTQHNLGAALQTLGERERGATHLEEAVTAYNAALLERTRERAPLDWAATQTGLGNALATLGECENNTTLLEQAVAAHQAALLEWTCERTPLDWATAQLNLGNALLALGERESGTSRLEQAIAAYHSASLEYTRKRTPLGWASLQYNMGNALAALATRLWDRVRMAEALGCMRNAAEACREGNNTYRLPIIEGRVSEIEAVLAVMRH